ncbi:hypothetical protein BGX30_015073, partial [Mortierella sp. GBA39]
CSSVGNALEEKPSEEFQIVAHDCITQVLRNYQRYGYDFPQESSEAWFNHHFPEEFHRSRRPNDAGNNNPGIAGNSWAIRWMGAVVISKRPVEICWMEAAKKDGGANTTKCLHHTRKLMEFMKDSHDMIREKAEHNIRYRLVTFALRISGPSVSIVTLSQRPGRFNQAAKEETQSLPLTWLGKDDTTQVLAIIARVLKLRKVIQVMAASISTWTQSTIDDESSGVKDWIVPTITSPQLLPVTLTSSAMTVPPLDI